MNTIENIGHIFSNRTKTLGDTGRIFGSSPSDYENTAREVIQVWKPLTADEAQVLKENNFNSAEREFGDERIIKQTYNEGKDEWQIDGKSYHWQPATTNTSFEEKN